MSSKPTVFIVDDDLAIVQAVTEVVEMIDLKAASFGSADDFLKAYKPTGPACLVLDVRMPGMSGLELQRELSRTGATLPVIIITGHADVRMVVDAMKQGALEFLEKPFRMQELCDEIQRAIRIDEENWRRREQREAADRRIAELTAPERQVMDLVIAGKTNKMIADELALSVRAIEDRRARMMRKLRVNSRAELLELASVFDSTRSTALTGAVT